MSYNPEDPRLTAYALGEMPETERAAFEAGLDDGDRAEIEAIRSLATLLGRELAAEATPSLTDSQRVAIHEIADQPLPRRRRFHWVVWLAAAASFAVLLGLLLPRMGQGNSVALETSPVAVDYSGADEDARERATSSLRKAMDTDDDGVRDGEEKEDVAKAALPSSPVTAKPEAPAVLATKIEAGGDSPQPPFWWETAAPLEPAPAAAPAEALKAKPDVTSGARVTTISGKATTIPILAPGNQHLAADMGGKGTTADGDSMAVPAPAYSAAKRAAAPAPGMVGASVYANPAVPAQTPAGFSPVAGAVAFPEPPAPAQAPASDAARKLSLAGGMEGGMAGGGKDASELAKGIRFANAADAPGGGATVGGFMAVDDIDGDGLTSVQEWAGGQPTPPPPAAAQVPVLGEPPMVGNLLRENVDANQKADQPNREAYDRIRDNPFVLVRQEPLSTFSIDVDTASYANVRRYLQRNHLPPPDAVRIEELVNYFDYAYEEPKGERPFSVSIDLAQCPWAPEHRLARVALKGREPDLAHRPPSNLVFLLDVSGSMNQPNKLPLVKETLRLLVNSLSENDRVAIVVYAGASGLVLPSTTCDHPETVLAALDRLQAGGSTNGGAGIQLAYQTAVENFIKGGTNRVILATDGDFNVGVSNRGELTRLIEEKAKSGVFLTVLGYGQGNLQDATLEELSGKGNGTYAYIDSVREAQKVMVQQLGGTLLTIAKDVKIQVEFNPGRITAYRLIGYENRLLAHQDFNDDTKDAGEIGAGLTVTAFYELVPRGVKIEIPGVDALKYQTTALADEAIADEAMTVKLRYKLPDSDTSTLLQEAVKDLPRSIKEMSVDYVFATAVATFGMVLRDSPYKGSASLALAEELARTGARRDPHGYRQEFVELIQRAKALKK